MRRKDVFKFVLIIFWVFIIGSMIGYGVETIVAIIQNGHFASRQGLLYGPLIPVYGVGLVAYYLVISKIKDKGNLKIFIITMVLGGIVEYLFSFFPCRGIILLIFFRKVILKWQYIKTELL